VHIYSSPGYPTRKEPAINSNDLLPTRHPKLPFLTNESEKPWCHSANGLSFGFAEHRQSVTDIDSVFASVVTFILIPPCKGRALIPLATCSTALQPPNVKVATRLELDGKFPLTNYSYPLIVHVLFPEGHAVDWARAIERNREALISIVAALFARLGLQGGATAGFLPRGLHRAVLRVLRPAESAMRRLIVIAARGLVVKLSPARPMPAGPIRLGSTPRVRFQLFDPRIRLAPERSRTGPRPIPRIHIFTNDPRVAALWAAPSPTAEPASPPPDGRVNGEALCRRLEALKLALDDLPRQARRLARWRARREKMPNPKFVSPLRPGRPPGHRVPVHEVDRVLAECHGLAFDATKPDTS
jgi:hypothetical protein